MNNGFPDKLLQSRSIIKQGLYALMAPEGLVNNSVPGFENAYVSILGSPRLGASFVDYIITFYEGGHNKERGFGGEANVETFLYVVDGKMKITAENKDYTLDQGGYIYCPPGEEMLMENINQGDSKIFLYKQKYKTLEGYKKPWLVTGNVNDIEEVEYDGIKEMRIKDLLPVDFAFDMNMHILTFDPGAGHPFIETHVQEHGAYLLSGEGVYNLDNDWVPVQKGDYIFMGPYVQQACYAAGRDKLSYIYSKDCNRDADL